MILRPFFVGVLAAAAPGVVVSRACHYAAGLGGQTVWHLECSRRGISLSRVNSLCGGCYDHRDGFFRGRGNAPLSGPRFGGHRPGTFGHR